MKTIPNNNKVTSTSASLLPPANKYLDAVEQWKINNLTGTDNIYSLLKDYLLHNNNNDDETNNNNGTVAAVNTTTTRPTISSSGTIDRISITQLATDKVVHELTSLYEDYTFITAKDASLTDDFRRRLQDPDNFQHSDDSLVYGEIDLRGFCNLLLDNDITLLSSSSSQHDSEGRGRGVFYDLGSGSGRAVFAARFLGDYDTVIGIELLSNLHQLAQSVQSLYKFQYQHKLQHRHVQFVESDLLDYDWSDGTVVYIPCLLFDTNMMKKIASHAIKLQRGAYVISLKKFAGDNVDHDECFQDAFELTKQQVVTMSWGDSNVYVYKRR